MPKKLIFSIILLSLVSVCLDGDWSEKKIFESVSDLTIESKNATKDITLAYNGAASCTTLKPVIMKLAAMPKYNLRMN